MTLRFCKKCKTLQSPQKKKGEIFLKCESCGFVEKIDNNDSLIIREKIIPKEEKGKGAVKDENIFATQDHICKKCGFGKAELIDLGIWYSDEDNVLLLRCGKCGYSEHVNRKIK